MRQLPERPLPSELSGLASSPGEEPLAANLGSPEADVSSGASGPTVPTWQQDVGPGLSQPISCFLALALTASISWPLLHLWEGWVYSGNRSMD